MRKVIIKNGLLSLLAIMVVLLVGTVTVYVYQNRHTSWAEPMLPTLMPTLALAVPEQTPQPLPSTHTPRPAAMATVGLTETAVPPTPLPVTTTPTPTLLLTATAVPTITATPTLYPTPILTLLPGAPQGYLDKFRLVAFYGSPTGPGLGILGNQPRAETLTLLRQRVLEYQPLSPERPILPTYHLIVAVASPNPPYYYTNIDLALIEEWVTAAAETGVAVILDIQPGQGDVLFIYKRIRHLFYNPHVHLAIDPEFSMAEGQIPGQTIGSLYASTINAVQRDLHDIAAEIGLNRVLVLHQFAGLMLPDKEKIEDYAYVELVIDGDGVGSPAAKIRNYTQYAQEPAFEYGGFKLFPTDGDYPLLTPQEVMSLLTPPPVLIIYQ